ncbi:cbb3-type cytochrome oxidase subunit 3 [Ideonella sp.]|uniref:cbb3-type cytochrome oxidase subunit 3 n=1 Tax=Ideonella sp. TaxID=1929293 RepID=UPI002B47C382|nr:CcoQ/FixQ family Cbb3-type cytochrome c oxidase assembly chaperone [Ideonella sp.]HJV70217.1 CcoQ/FixQ family Cbb3-type cytochrome c oxidase assembly chaperone [Ideonella sp.]
MEFDVNTWRSLITVLSLVLFLGLIAWTMNRRRLPAFEEAAHLPFADEGPAWAGDDTTDDSQRSNKQ